MKKIIRNHHKIIFSLLIALIILGFAATAAFAQDELNLTNKLGTVGVKAGFDAPESTSLPLIIGRVVNIFLSILGMVFMGYIIYAGSIWITARGNDEQINKAKSILRGSIIGLIVVFAAYAITFFVVARLVTETGFNAPI